MRVARVHQLLQRELAATEPGTRTAFFFPDCTRMFSIQQLQKIGEHCKAYVQSTRFARVPSSEHSQQQQLRHHLDLGAS